VLEAALRDDLLTGLGDSLEAAALRVDVTRALLHAEQIMEERTMRGEFLPGSSPGAGQYSTRPFALPSAALPKAVREMLDDTADKWLREALGYQSSHVDLTRSGGLLGGLTTRVRTEGGQIGGEVGYPDGADEDAAALADFHQNQGVGPRRVIRRFVGLTDDEAELVVADFAEAVRRQITE
jgi:hypothetical protein